MVSANHRTQQRRRGRIEHVADVVVGGDFGDTEKRLAQLERPVAFLQLALMRPRAAGFA